MWKKRSRYYQQQILYIKFRLLFFILKFSPLSVESRTTNADVVEKRFLFLFFFLPYGGETGAHAFVAPAAVRIKKVCQRLETDTASICVPLDRASFFYFYSVSRARHVQLYDAKRIHSTKLNLVLFYFLLYFVYFFLLFF